jgi:hypothetical protein
VLTVTDAAPVLVSLVAVICAEPAATAVTNPLLALTDATAEFELDQLTTRPVRVLPFASRVVAVSCAVLPTVSVVEEGETVTVATGAGAGAITVTDALPVFPSLVAVTCAEPAATAVTNPVFAFTEATFEFELDHVITRPVSVLPLASRVVAESWALAPTFNEVDEGETVTVATGTGVVAVTVIVELPV